MSISDMAAQTAQRLQNLYLADTKNVPQVVDEAGPMVVDERNKLFSKIEFKWRAGDAAILDQIRAASDQAFREMYSEAGVILDHFYASLRIAETNDHGVALRDSRGRVLWQKDSRGQEIENWSQLTGDDLEKCLFDLTRLKLVLAPQLNELLLEAVFARHIADDAHQDGYASVMEGTVGDRNAAASKAARQDKYHAFFLYWLYSQADVFMKEITNFCRILERIRYWRIEDGSPPSRSHRT